MSEEGKLPKGWEVKKLGEVCNLQSGVAFKSADYVGKSNTLCFRMSQIRPGGILDLNHNSKYLPDQFNEIYKDYRLKERDVVIAMTDMATETRILGVPTYFKSDGRNYLLNQRVGRLFDIDSEKVDIQFLRYVLTAPIINRYYKSFGKGALQINLGKNDILNARIPLPPLPEQQSIVAKIEELLSDLENGKKQLQTAQEQLKVYRQSLLKAAFEGKLTNENVKEGELPKGWKIVRVIDVANTIGGYAFKSGHFLSEGQYQVLRMGNVRPGVVRYNECPVFLDKVDESVLCRSILQINDVIITQTGTRKKRDYGFTALIQKPNLLLNQRIAAIRFSGKCLPKFFLYYSWTNSFKDQFFANETGNVGQGNVGMKAITETLIPIPPIAKQKQIVDILESKLTICDKISETITQSLLHSETLRQSILKKAFEGKLTRLNFDSCDLNDEDDIKQKSSLQNHANQDNHKNHSSDNVRKKIKVTI